MKLKWTRIKCPTLCGESNGLLFYGFSATPSFKVPVSSNFDEFKKESVQMVKPAKGTTILAFIFKDGVMVAADSGASMGGYIYLFHYDMTIDEAAELARRSIYHATFRGGVASVYHVGPNGCTKLSGDDVRELHYIYYPVEPATVEQEMAELVE